QWQQISASRQQKVQSTPPVEGNKVQKDKEKENQGKNAHQGHQFSENSSEHTEQGKKVNQGVSDVTDPVRGHLIDIKT
ncbi:MAG: hypothetical protein PHQ46_11940, partial [Negativicutes bacterium]|nr:hypothetical protein [Negativicutes bacterium]